MAILQCVSKLIISFYHVSPHNVCADCVVFDGTLRILVSGDDGNQ